MLKSCLLVYFSLASLIANSLFAQECVVKIQGLGDLAKLSTEYSEGISFRLRDLKKRCEVGRHLGEFNFREGKGFTNRSYVVGRRYVAHAGGAIYTARPPLALTNSLEALTLNYKKGFRKFEIDFQWSSDEVLIALHDWQDSFRKFFPNRHPPITAFDFQGLTSRFLTLATIDDILDWFHKNPDTYLITDIKRNNVGALNSIYKKAQKYPDLNKRILPQIYSPSQYQEVLNLGFRNVILTLYDMPMKNLDSKLNEFLKTNSPYAITIPSWSRYSQLRDTLSSLLEKRDVLLYTHTVNGASQVNSYFQSGFDGIYSDYISGI